MAARAALEAVEALHPPVVVWAARPLLLIASRTSAAARELLLRDLEGLHPHIAQQA